MPESGCWEVASLLGVSPTRKPTRAIVSPISRKGIGATWPFGVPWGAPAWVLFHVAFANRRNAPAPTREGVVRDDCPCNYYL